MKLIKYQIKEVRKLKPYLLKFFQDNQLKTSKLLEIEEIKKELNNIIFFDLVKQISTNEEKDSKSFRHAVCWSADWTHFEIIGCLHNKLGRSFFPSGDLDFIWHSDFYL